MSRHKKIIAAAAVTAGVTLLPGFAALAQSSTDPGRSTEATTTPNLDVEDPRGSDSGATRDTTLITYPSDSDGQVNTTNLDQLPETGLPLAIPLALVGGLVTGVGLAMSRSAKDG